VHAHLGKTGKAMETEEYTAAKMLSGAFNLQCNCQHHFTQLGILNRNKLRLLWANPSINILIVKNCSFSFQSFNSMWFSATPHHKQISTFQVFQRWMINGILALGLSSDRQRVSRDLTGLLRTTKTRAVQANIEENKHTYWETHLAKQGNHD